MLQKNKYNSEKVHNKLINIIIFVTQNSLIIYIFMCVQCT